MGAVGRVTSAKPRFRRKLWWSGGLRLAAARQFHRLERAGGRWQQREPLHWATKIHRIDDFQARGRKPWGPWWAWLSE